MMQADHLTRDFQGYGNNPPDPKWPGGAKLAFNFVINVEEGSEPSIEDGDAESESGLTEGASGNFKGRDLAAETMFEFGSRVGYWRIARLFEERAIPATIMACALALERNPQIASHVRNTSLFDVCAHGWRWEHHRGLSIEQERENIARAAASILKTTGKQAEGWYCRYGPSINTRQLLSDAGFFLYDSDAYNDELPYWLNVGEKKQLVVPYSLTNNDAKFMRGSIDSGEAFFRMLRESFDMLMEEGNTAPKMMSVGLHLRIAGHPGRASGLQRFLDYVATHRDDVWVCNRSDIARHWHTHHQPEATK
jgi:allantoinase